MSPAALSKIHDVQTILTFGGVAKMAVDGIATPFGPRVLAIRIRKHGEGCDDH